MGRARRRGGVWATVCACVYAAYHAPVPVGCVTWEWDGVRYIQQVNPFVDGEYWSRYKPDPPHRYKWPTFLAHSADSFSRHGRYVCTVAMQGQYGCESVGDATVELTPALVPAPVYGHPAEEILPQFDVSPNGTVSFMVPSAQGAVAGTRMHVQAPDGRTVAFTQPPSALARQLIKVTVAAARNPVPGWLDLVAHSRVSRTQGDTSTLAALERGAGFGEWVKRSRYDDGEGHPYLEYMHEADDDCHHPRAVECLNGGTCYDFYEDVYCHCTKGYSGKHCELGALHAQAEIPARWRCPVSAVGNQDGCDCDCGGWDPDCDDPTQPVVNCKPSEKCQKLETAGDKYGMCVYSLDRGESRKFRPRFTPGITFGVAFSEDHEETFLGAFDTTTGQIYHVRNFPYGGPNPTYGNSVYDEKNQVYYCLVDRIHDADLETRIIGINVETADLVVDLVFNYTVSSMKFDQIDGAIYFVALEDQDSASSLVRFNISAQSLERVSRTTAFCPPNSVIEDPTCTFNMIVTASYTDAGNVTVDELAPQPQAFGIEVGQSLNLKHFEHTYGMAAFDDVNHTYYTVVRLSPHINGLVGVSARTGTIVGKCSLPHEITSIDINPQFSEHRHSYQELHNEVHLRAPLVGLAGPPALDSSPLTTQVASKNKLYYIDTRNLTHPVSDTVEMYGEHESQLFLASYDTVRNNEYAVTDDEFAHSHISTVKADLQGKEQQHYLAKSLQNKAGGEKRPNTPFSLLQNDPGLRASRTIPDGFVDMHVSQFPFITEIRPWAGPTWGNTTVNVTGLNFFAADRIECRFGPLTVYGAFDPLSRSIVCIAPPQPPGKVILELSLYGDGHNSVVGERITNQVRYDYYVQENSTWLVPAMGPHFGNTSLLMRGEALFNNATVGEWVCKFEDLQTAGTYFKHTAAQCWVPPESALQEFENCTAICVWRHKHKPFAQDDVDRCVSSCVHGGGLGYGEFGYPSGFRDTIWPYGMIPVDPMPEPEPEPELNLNGTNSTHSTRRLDDTRAESEAFISLRRLQYDSVYRSTSRQLQDGMCDALSKPEDVFGPGAVPGSCGTGTVGATCVLGCAFGYEAVVNIPGTCVVDSIARIAWSGAHIRCVVSCGAPPSIKHGSVQWSSGTENAEALYSCEDGYRLDDPDQPTRKCRGSGVWTASDGSDIAPECVRHRKLDEGVVWTSLTHPPPIVVQSSSDSTQNSTNGTNTTDPNNPCVIVPRVCYESKAAYHEFLAAQAVSPANTSNATGLNATKNTSAVGYTPNPWAKYEPGCMITGPSPDGNPHGTTAALGSQCASVFNHFGATYSNCTLNHELDDGSTPSTQWCYVPVVTDGVVTDDCSTIGHTCPKGLCTGCSSPSALSTPLNSTGNHSTDHCANGTSVNGTACNVSQPVQFCVEEHEQCPDGYVKPLTDEEKRVNGTVLLDYFVDRVMERVLSTRAIVLYFPEQSRPAVIQPVTNPFQQRFLNAVIEQVAALDYMDPVTGEISQVGTENIYVLSVGQAATLPVTPFKPPLDPDAPGIPHVFDCRWTDVYCEQFIPEDTVGPEPEPEPEPEPMYEPEPEEEEFEFDPGDPDLPRCIPCYIRWWNMYYAPVGYPNLLWSSSRRLLSEAYDTVIGHLQNLRRKLAETVIEKECPEGYTGDNCEWLTSYPTERPVEPMQGFEVVLTFNEYIDTGQMYHNIIVNMTDEVNGLAARLTAVDSPNLGYVPPVAMFAVGSDLGLTEPRIREKLRIGLQNFGDSCYELCNPRDSCEDLCTDPRVVPDKPKACSLINTSFALLDYGVLCDGMLNEANMGHPENRSRIFYAYDHFEDIRGPLMLTTNGSLAYEDPSVEQVFAQARKPNEEYKLDKRIGTSSGGPGLYTPLVLLLDSIVTDLYRERFIFVTSQMNGTIQKPRTFSGLMLAGVDEAYWYTRMLGRYFIGPDVYEVLGPQAFVPVRTRAVTFNFANNGQQYTPEGPRFFYYDAPAVHTMFPALGPDYGDTFITMEGANFIEGPGLQCLFDDWDPARSDVKMKASFVWPWRLNCVSPPHVADPLDYVFTEASNNDQQYTREGAIFDYYPAPNVTAVVPPTAPKRGDTLITVSGIEFLDKTLHQNTITQCRFGGPKFPISEITPAVYVDENTMRCFTPETEAGTFDIDITLNGQQFTDGHVKFTFFGIDSITPPLGPEFGGTKVQVFGKGFTETDGVRCKFGDMPVDGIYISFYEIQCVSPAFVVMDNIRTVPFEITFFMEEWTDSGLNFTYYDNAYIFSIQPQIEGQGLGPDWGGTYVRVEGSNFVNHWSRLNRCKFSRTALLGAGAASANNTAGGIVHPDYIVEAVYVSNSVMYCYAPRYWLTDCNRDHCVDEPVQVTVSYNAQQYTDAMSGMTKEYTYYPQLKISWLSPTNGPAHGGYKFGQFIQSVAVGGFSKPPRYENGPAGYTVITVYGDNFNKEKLTDKTFCRWHNITVKAQTIASRNELTCNGERTDPPGKYDLEVTRNLQDYSESRDPSTPGSKGSSEFNWYGERQLAQFVPRSGYIEGHTRVLLLGTGFVNTTQIPGRVGKESIGGIRTQFGQHPPIAAEFLKFNRTNPRMTEGRGYQWCTGSTAITQCRPDEQGLPIGLEPYKTIYIASTMMITIAPEHQATGKLDVIMTTNMQEWTLSPMKFYFSRTYAKASLLHQHKDGNQRKVGEMQAFLIEGRSKESIGCVSDCDRWRMTEGGDFFYVDLWGGDTRVRDLGKPFHFSSVVRDDRFGLEQVNITDNTCPPDIPSTPANPCPLRGPDQPDEPGTYWAQYYTTMSGVYYVEVMLSGDQIRDAPFHVAIHPNYTNPAMSFAFPGYSGQADGVVEMQAGLAALFHIQMRDSYGNNRTESSSTEKVLLRIKGPGEETPGCCTDAAYVPSRASVVMPMFDGTYDVWWVSITLGFYQVNVTVLDPENPYIIQDELAPRSADGPTMFIGQYWDYTQFAPNSRLWGTLPVPDDPSANWWDTYAMLQPSPWETECRPGEPSTFATRAMGDGLLFARAGEPSFIRIQAIDLFGNFITEGGGLFVWRLDGPTVSVRKEGGCAGRGGGDKSCCDPAKYLTRDEPWPFKAAAPTKYVPGTADDVCQSLIIDHEDGTYSFNYTSYSASEPAFASRKMYILSILLTGSWAATEANPWRPIDGFPKFEIYVYPGDSYGPNSYAVGAGVDFAVTGKQSEFRLYPVDRYGNHKQFGENETVTITLTSDAGVRTYGTFTNCPKCVEGNGDLPSRNRPDPRIMWSHPVAPTCDNGDGFVKLADGTDECRDISAWARNDLPPLTTQENGQRRRPVGEFPFYHVGRYTPKDSGFYFLMVQINGLPIQGSEGKGFFITIPPPWPTIRQTVPNASPIGGGAMLVLDVEYDVREDYYRWLDVIKSLDPADKKIPERDRQLLGQLHKNSTVNTTYYEIFFTFESFNETGIEEEVTGYLENTTGRMYVTAPAVTVQTCPTCNYTWTTKLQQRTAFQEFSRDYAVDFVYYDVARIEASGLTLSPPMGPDYGDTEVIVSFDGLFDSGQANCRFDGVVTPARSVGVCSEHAGSIRTEDNCTALGVCDHGDATTAAECESLGSCFLSDVAVPTAVTKAACDGIDQASWTPARWTSANATWITSGTDVQLSCRSPAVNQINASGPNPAHAVMVEFSLNGQQYAHTNTTFLHYAPAVVHSVLPKTGPLRGATHTMVTGSNFWDTGLILCRHGAANTATSARYNMSSLLPPDQVVTSTTPVMSRWRQHLQTSFRLGATSAITCSSPRSLGVYGPGENVQIEVALNGQQFSASVDRDNFYTFYSRPTLDTVQPQYGPVSGGSTIILTAKAGARFPTADTRESTCVFIQGEKQVMTPAVYNPLAAVVTCDTPLWPLAAHVRVEVALNGQQPSISSVQFAFVPVVTGLDVHFGPFGGDTTVHVLGSGFIDTSVSRRVGLETQILNHGKGRCVFIDSMTWIETISTLATYVNESAVVCTTPNWARSLTINSDYSPTYLRDMHVHVTMDACSEASCFGNFTSEGVDGVDGVDTDNIFQLYQPPVVVTAVDKATTRPTAVMSGGTLLVLKGSYIHPVTPDTTTLPARCGFYGETEFFSSPVETVLQPSGPLSPGEVTCKTPVLDQPQDVYIGLALNGQQYGIPQHDAAGGSPMQLGRRLQTANSQPRFNFYNELQPPTITSSRPKSANMQGGDRITVYGSNFADLGDTSLACRIDGLEQGTVHPRTQAQPQEQDRLVLQYDTIFVSSHEITCIATTHYEMRQGWIGHSGPLPDTEPDPTNKMANTPSKIDVTNALASGQYSSTYANVTYIDLSLARTDSVLFASIAGAPSEIVNPSTFSMSTAVTPPVNPILGAPSCSDSNPCKDHFSCKYDSEADASSCILTVTAGVVTTFFIESRETPMQRLMAGGEFFMVDLQQQCQDDALLPQSRCSPPGKVSNWTDAVDLDPGPDPQKPRTSSWPRDPDTDELIYGTKGLPGYYLATIRLTVRGLYLMNVLTSGQRITASPFDLVIEYGAADAASSFIWGPGLTGAVVSTAVHTDVYIQSRDAYGNNRTEDTSDNFVLDGLLERTPQREKYNYPMAALVDLLCLPDVTCPVKPDPAGGGVYKASYFTSKAGEYEVRVTLNQDDLGTAEQVDGSPFSIFVDPGPLLPSASTAQGTDAFGYGRDKIIAGEDGLFHIIARDKYTNAKLVGGATFNATFTAASTDPWYPAYIAGDPDLIADLNSLGVTIGPSFLSPKIQDMGDSSYDATYRLTLAGEFRLEVFHVDPTDPSRTTPIKGSPFPMTVLPAATHFPFCRMYGPGPKYGEVKGSVAGTGSPVYVWAKDQYYNDRGPGTDNFTMTLTGLEAHNTNVSKHLPFTSLRELDGNELGGVFNTTILMTVAGKYAMGIFEYKTRQHIANSPKAVVVEPAATVADRSIVIGLEGMQVKAGDFTPFIVQPRDRYGNNQTYQPGVYVGKKGRAGGFKLIFDPYCGYPKFWEDSMIDPTDYFFLSEASDDGAVQVHFKVNPVVDHSIRVQFEGSDIQGSPQTVRTLPLDPPQLKSIKFYDEMIRLRVKFDRPTNRGYMKKNAPCSEIFDEASTTLLDGHKEKSVCNWLDASELTVTLGYQPNVTLGSVLTLRSAFPEDDTQNSASVCSRKEPGILTELANSYRAIGSAEVEISDDPPLVKATVKGPLVIGVCDAVTIDGSLSAGAGLRKLDYKWKATQALDQLLVSKFPPQAFSTYVAIAARTERDPVTDQVSNGDKIVLGYPDLVASSPDGGPRQLYGVRMDAQNDLGYQDRVESFEFIKACTPVPTLQIAGDMYVNAPSTKAVILAGDAFPSQVKCACKYLENTNNILRKKEDCEVGYRIDDGNDGLMRNDMCVQCRWDSDAGECKVRADHNLDELGTKMLFEWRQSAPSTPNNHMVKLSDITRQTKKTMIPGGTMIAGETYLFTLIAWYAAKPEWNNTANVQVTVTLGRLSASIAGGSRIIAASQPLVLDASGSEDADNTNEPMSYTWECVHAYDRSKPCLDARSTDLAVELLPYPSTFVGDPIVTLAPYSLCSVAAAAAGRCGDRPACEATGQCGQYVVLLTASKLFSPQGDERPRRATAEVTLTVVGGSPPAVNIEWVTKPINKLIGKQNPDEPFRMVGSYQNTSATGGPITTMWYMTSGDLVDADGTLNDLRKDGRLRTERSQLNFVIAPLALTPGASYSFALEATDAATGATGVANIDITVNSPPGGGTFTVVPLSGVSMVTGFTLNATMWNDAATDYPITYGFKYLKGSQVLTIGEESDMNIKKDVLLPEGEATSYDGTNFTGLVVIVDIMDALLASTRQFQPIVLNSKRRSMTESADAEFACKNTLQTMGALLGARTLGLRPLPSCNVDADPNGPIPRGCPATDLATGQYCAECGECPACAQPPCLCPSPMQKASDVGSLDTQKDLVNIAAQFLNGQDCGAHEMARRRRLQTDNINYADNSTLTTALSTERMVVTMRGHMMAELSKAANSSEMHRSSRAANAAGLAAISQQPASLEMDSISLGMELVEASLSGVAHNAKSLDSVDTQVGQDFGNGLSQLYAGTQLIRRPFALNCADLDPRDPACVDCPYVNGTRHTFACNETDPDAGLKTDGLRPCPAAAELTAAEVIAQTVSGQLGDTSVDGCCDIVLDEDEAFTLCQQYAAAGAGRENSRVRQSAQTLISSLMVDKLQNEDGVMVDTDELQLLGAKSFGSSFGNLSLSADTMPDYLRNGARNRSMPAFSLPADMLDAANGATNASLGKVDVQVINYQGNPTEWSLDSDSTVVGAVTSLTISSSTGAEVRVNNVPSPIVIVIPIKRPTTPDPVGMNYSGLDFDLINSTTTPVDGTSDNWLYGNQTDMWWDDEHTVTGWFGNDTYYWDGIVGPGEFHHEKCKYWDEDFLVWRTDGCVTVENTSTHVTCHCTHLTDFSVLLDEFKPELNLNVIDPFGDAALLANINPDNMFPLLLVGGLYILYGSLCFISKRKDVADRKRALRLASEQDPDEMPTEEEQDEPQRGLCGRLCGQFKTGMAGEHSLLSVASTSHDDEFTRCMRITVVFCIIIGTYAIDAAFNAGDAGGDTLGAMITTSIAVALCMYPCDLLFVYMFAKVGPTSKQLSDKKSEAAIRVDHMPSAKAKSKPKRKNPQRRVGPGKPSSSGPARKPPPRRPGLIGKKPKTMPGARYAVPSSINAAACTIQGVWRGYMVRKYLGDRIAGEAGAPSSDPPPPPVSEQGQARPSRGMKGRMKGRSASAGGPPEQLVPLPTDAPRRPRPRGKSTRGSPGRPGGDGFSSASDMDAPPKPPAGGRLRPSGHRVRRTPGRSGPAPLGVPPPPPAPTGGSARPRRIQRQTRRSSAASTAWTESDSDSATGVPPPPPPIGTVVRPRRRGGANVASRRGAGGGTTSAAAPPPPSMGTRRPSRGASRSRGAGPMQPPPPPELLSRSAGAEILRSRHPRSRRPPSIHAAPNPPPPPPPPPTQAAQAPEADVRRPRRRQPAGSGDESSGPDAPPPPPPPPGGGMPPPPPPGGGTSSSGGESRRPTRRSAPRRADSSMQAPPPPPPEVAEGSARPSLRGDRQRLNITRNTVPPPPPPVTDGTYQPPTRRRHTRGSSAGGSSQGGSRGSKAAPGIPQKIWDAVIIIQCHFRGYRARTDLSNFRASEALRASRGKDAPSRSGFSQRPRRRMAPRSQPKRNATGVPPPPPPPDGSDDPRRRVGARRQQRAAVDKAEDPQPPPPPMPADLASGGQYVPRRGRSVRAGPQAAGRRTTSTATGVPAAIGSAVVKLQAAFRGFHARRQFDSGRDMPPPPPPPEDSMPRPRRRKGGGASSTVPPPPPGGGTGRRPRGRGGGGGGGGNKEMEIEELNRCAVKLQCSYRGHLVRTGRVVRGGKVQPAKKSQRQKMMAGSRMGKKAFERGKVQSGGKGETKRTRRRVKRPAKKEPPPLPFWFLHVTYILAWLWMLISGFFIVLYGLKFEVQVCSFEKFEKNECEPDQEPVECDYPTKHGCMDVTYEWLWESTMAMGFTWIVAEPFTLFVGVVRSNFLGSLSGLVDYWEDIKDQLERFLPS